MKKLMILLSAAAVILSCIGILAYAAGGNAEPAYLVRNGEPEYSIVYSQFWTQNSANYEIVEYLRDLIAEQTGVELPIYAAESAISDREIYVGNTLFTLGSHKQRAEECGLVTLDMSITGNEGFAVFSSGSRYIIAADSYDGAKSGVKCFMKDILGCDPADVPEKKRDDLTVPAEVSVRRSDYLECGTDAVMEIDGAGIGEYRIVYSSDRGEGTEKDAPFFETVNRIRRYLFAITGSIPELKSDASAPSDREIVIGRTNRRDFRNLDENDMVISLEDGRLYICGGNENTTSAACDLFCARILGVSGGRYTGGSVIRVAAGTDIRESSAFARYAAEGSEPTDYLRDNLGTLLGLDDTPCFSDPAAAEKLYEAITGVQRRSGEEVFIICNRPDWCGCEKCGGKTAAFLETVNAVADRLAEVDISVSIVAVNELRRPSVDSMSDNVWIYFAEPHVCCAHALNDPSCGENAATAGDLEAWTEISRNICVLDFTMDYQYYPSTFPDLDVIRPNFAFYAEKGVNGVFMVWKKGGAALEFGDIRSGLINALIQDPSMSDGEYEKLKNGVIDGLYKESAGVIREYIGKFTEAAADHFTITSRPEEILPIKRTGGGTGAGAYDLTLAKEFAGMWESIYKRHDPPVPPLYGTEMDEFEKAYYGSDYYLPLHSRVQLTEWINANIPQEDRNAVFTEIVNSYKDR